MANYWGLWWITFLHNWLYMLLSTCKILSKSPTHSVSGSWIDRMTFAIINKVWFFISENICSCFENINSFRLFVDKWSTYINNLYIRSATHLHWARIHLRNNKCREEILSHPHIWSSLIPNKVAQTTLLYFNIHIHTTLPIMTL